MINYCCSRCGEKVPADYSHQVDLTDLNPTQLFKPKKSYILCLACRVELETWMEEDEKEETKTRMMANETPKEGIISSDGSEVSE